MSRTIHRAVITGPTGAIGQALCRRLLADGIEVCAVVRPASPRAGGLPAGVHLVECDMNDLARLPERIPGGADAFFHLAWGGTIGPDRDSVPVQYANIGCALDALRAASSLGCRVFVGAGSQAEYGPFDGTLTVDTPCSPITMYGTAKLCAGRMCLAMAPTLGLDAVWGRICSVYGPGDSPRTVISIAARALLAGDRPALTACTQPWDFLYCDDAAAALCACALSGRAGQTYLIASGHSEPLRAYMECLRDAIDPTLPLGFGEYIPAAPPYGLRADVSALTRDTGFLPATPFERGIIQTVKWYKEHPYA